MIFLCDFFLVVVVICGTFTEKVRINIEFA